MRAHLAVWNRAVLGSLAEAVDREPAVGAVTAQVLLVAVEAVVDGAGGGCDCWVVLHALEVGIQVVALLAHQTDILREVCSREAYLTVRGHTHLRHTGTHVLSRLEPKLTDRTNRSVAHRLRIPLLGTEQTSINATAIFLLRVTAVGGHHLTGVVGVQIVPHRACDTGIAIEADHTVLGA